MATRLNTALRNVLADATASQFNDGTIEIYTGAQPASANDASTGTLLATVELPNPAFSAASSGVASKNGTWTALAVETDEAGWFRMKSSDGLTIKDGAVTAVAGGGEIELSNITITSGSVVVINSATITQPAEVV